MKRSLARASILVQEPQCLLGRIHRSLQYSRLYLIQRSEMDYLSGLPRYLNHHLISADAPRQSTNFTAQLTATLGDSAVLFSHPWLVTLSFLLFSFPSLLLSFVVSAVPFASSRFDGQQDHFLYHGSIRRLSLYIHSRTARGSRHFRSSRTLSSQTESAFQPPNPEDFDTASQRRGDSRRQGIHSTWIRSGAARLHSGMLIMAP